MDTKELLLTTSEYIQQYSACLWDYTSTNSVHQYKNGGRAAQKSLEILSRDYILIADEQKPLLTMWPLNSQEPNKDTKLILPGKATCITMCPFSIYLAAGIGAKLFIWHLSSGKLLTVQEKHYQPISVIRFSSDGTYLSIGGEDGTLITYKFAHLVDFQNNILAQSDAGHVEPLYTKTDHSSKITDMFVGVFGAKSRIVTVSSDKSCFVYELCSGKAILKLAFPEALSAAVFNNTCWDLFVGDYKGRIRQVKLSEPRQSLEKVNSKGGTSLNFVGHREKITCLAINFDNTILASGSSDHTINIWQIFSRCILKTIEQKGTVTNIKFVLNYDNFFSRHYVPSTILKKLERHFDPSNQSLDVCINQTCDLEEDEEYLNEERLASLMLENRFLRATNKQIYDTSLAVLNKKTKLTS